ncbi:hypothetical protein C0J52_00471 [Blattella germanica]|nr:hypothetical protein C0J52_00471 [Blattella germanica]
MIYKINCTTLIDFPVNMLKALKRNEINVRALGFSHDRPNHFVKSLWQKAEGVSIIYLVYRWLFCLFFISVWIYSLYDASLNNHGHTLKRWPIYLTHWGYTLCTVQAITATSIVTQRFIKERATVGLAKRHNLEDDDICNCCIQMKKMPTTYLTYTVGLAKHLNLEDDMCNQMKEMPITRLLRLHNDGYYVAVGFTEDHTQMPRIYKTYWFLQTLAVVIAVGITGSYFVVDYDPATHQLTALNLLVHAFNSILMVIDIIIVAHPIRLLHIVYTFSFIIFYFSFTVFYYLAGGTGRYDQPYIYPALDWRDVKKTLPVATLGAMSVLLSHFCIWLVSIGCKRISKACTQEEISEDVKISKPATNQVQPINNPTPEASTKNLSLV